MTRMENHRITGVPYCPVTAFDDAGEFSRERFEHRLSRKIDGVEFAFVWSLASLGEFAYLRAAERKRVAKATVEAVDGALPVYIGVHSTATASATEFATHAEDIGADGVVLNPWAYYPHTDEEVLGHYEAVADAIDLPIIAYDNPGTTNVTIDGPLLDALAAIDGVEHIKSATPDLAVYRNLVDTWGDDFSIFPAPPHSFEKLAYGADGWMTILANVRPEQAIDLFETYESGEFAAFRERYAPWKPLLEFIYQEHLAVGLKAIANLQGDPVGEPRAPLQPLSEAKLDTLEGILRDLDAV